MKRISWLLLIMFFLSVVLPGVNLPGELAMAADTLRVAKITAVQGDVKVLRAGGEKTFPAFKGMGLTQGDSIITGKDGRVTLELAEDKELKIGENSRVMISELVQSQEDNADKTSLNLKAGQVYTNVKSKLSPGAKYEIRTPTAVMGVRGTQFFVSLRSGGQAKVVTLEGRVIVTVPQVVTREDGTTVTQDVEIEVQPNQIFVQTGDMTEPGRYDLDTLTGDEELSLFVLETLQEISQQQPELINPEILQNLEERIEQARQEQEQQREQERQQEELEQNIRYDNDTGRESESSSGSGGRNNNLPQLVITTELDDVHVLSHGEQPWMYTIETDPAEDVELEVEVEDTNIAEVSLDGNTLFIYGLEVGTTTVTVTASKEGYQPAEVSFTVTVYEEGDWDKSIIDEYEGSVRYTDIALDSEGMPHVIYTAGQLRYRHWNGSSWQEEEHQADGYRGSLTIAEDGSSLVSYNTFGSGLGCSRFDGENWHYHSFGNEEMDIDASSVTTAEYDEAYVTGISYYNAENGDLYFAFDEDSTDIIPDTWRDEVLVDGENSDAGEHSSLAFTQSESDLIAYIAYYDYYKDEETEIGSLKIAALNPYESNESGPILDIEVIDSAEGEGVGQFVSLALYGEQPHLAYYDAVNQALKYARFSDGEWLIETVDDSEGDVGKYASLALDNEGNPHISYYAQDDSGEALKYARRDPNNEGEWLIEVIDQGEEIGWYSSMALESDSSIPHFVYTARTEEGRAVKHATRKGVMNTIEPGVLYGTAEAFGDESFYIESFDNGYWYASEEEGEYLTTSNFVLTPDDDGLVFTLKSDYLNSLEPGIHRLWIYFDYGLPVLITVEVTVDDFARYNPDLAYDRINNRYLMVYQRSEIDHPFEIWGRFINAEGKPGPEFPISEDKHCVNPKVAYNPENNTFLVTWQYEEDYLIYAQILDEDGNPYGDKGNFAVCPVTVNGQYYPAVAVNTSTGDYLIAWDEQVYDGNLQREIYGQFLDLEGDPIGGRQDLVSMAESQEGQVLAYSSVSDRYLLVFRDTADYINSDVKGKLFNSAGAPVPVLYQEGEPVFDIEIAVGDADQYAHALAAGNGRFLVVWQEYSDDDVYNIYGRFINFDGTMAEDAFPIYPIEEDQYAPCVAYNTADDTFLVVWRNNDDTRLYAKEFTADDPEAGEPVQIIPEGDMVINIKVAYNSNENNYLVVYDNEIYEPYKRGINYTILQPQLN